VKRTILIPMDGSESADETILYASSMRPKSETRTVLLHVTPTVNPVNASIDNVPDVKTVYDALNSQGCMVASEVRIGG